MHRSLRNRLGLRSMTDVNLQIAPARALYLHVFRVEEGLGNACVMQLPDGSYGVVDWGTDKEEVLDIAVSLFHGQSVRFVVATHAHADHTLGISKLLERCHREGIRVDRFVYPVSTLNRENSYLTKARQAARLLKIEMNPLDVDRFESPDGLPQPPWLAWQRDFWDVRVLAPAKSRVGSAEIAALEQGAVPGNDTSMVILFRFCQSNDSGIGRALLPGDATPAIQR